MSSLMLEGTTLGQKHEYYNSIVKLAITDDTFELGSVAHDDSDIDNLLRIEVACGRRNVDYVLDVLRGGDALYTARALRRSAWLFTDEEYAHIVNPHFLHRELFPNINTKVKNKLLLAIRLNLKNEARVNEFYNFYKDKFEFSQKWLPQCSDALVISVLKKDATKIHVNILKRLCRKSVAILKACCEINPSPDWLRCGKTFLYSHPEDYLELLSSADQNKIPKLGKKATRFLMNKYPDVILDQFHKYCYKIDLPEFAKYFTTTEAIQDFLFKQTRSYHYEGRTWCKHMHLKYLIRKLPEDQRCQFVREVIIDRRKKDVSSERNTEEEDNEEDRDSYPWYRYFPFETAFSSLKDIVFGRNNEDNKIELMFELFEPIGSPQTLSWILKILVRSARGNTHHIQTLLRHYRANYVIEPYDYYYYEDPISSFICKITKTHKFDEITWNMLNDIFYSIGIYDEDINIIVPYCIQAIVLYNILHGIRNPKIIEEKIKLSYFRTLPQKLEPIENEKVFAYLYNCATKEIELKEIKSKADLEFTLSKCSELVRFLEVWNRDVVNFPLVVNKINELTKVKAENTWGTDSEIRKVFCRFYKEHKRLRIHLFQESLFLCLSDETCLNALKHDPDLFFRQSWVEKVTSTEAVSLRRTLMKLRIYWPRSETEQWVKGYLNALRQPAVNKACVEGFFVLVPSKEALNIIDKHISEVTETGGKRGKDLLLFGRYMCMLRPAISHNNVFPYLEKAGFRFSAQFLDHIMGNSCHAEAAPFVTKLLSERGSLQRLGIRYLLLSQFNTNDSTRIVLDAAPFVPKLLSERGSLQRLGIRYLLSQLDTNESKRIVLDVWNNTNRSSVKSGLFKHIYKYLIKGKSTNVILNAWDILSEVIDNLPQALYEYLKNKVYSIEKVPELVRINFFMKSYRRVLSQLISNDQKIMTCYMRHNVKHFDVSFVEHLLLETKDQYFSEDNDMHYKIKEQRWDMLRFLTEYVTSNEGIESQQIKFEILIVPLLERFATVWPTENTLNKCQEYKDLLRRFLESLSLNVSKRFTKQFVVPTNLYRKVQNCIKNTFSLEEDYFLITFWNISVIFVEILENFSKSDLFHTLFDKFPCNRKQSYYDYRYEVSEIKLLYSHIAPTFGQECLKYFKQDDMLSQCPDLFPLASKSVMNAFISLSFPYTAMYKTLKHMLFDEKSENIYHVANGVIRCMFLNSGYGKYVFTVDEELKNIILSHPSRVIRTNYYYSISQYSFNYNEQHNTYWRRSGFMNTYGPNNMNVY